MREWCHAIIGLVLVTAPVSAATFYVAPTGNDANSGAIDAPLSNIAVAVNLVGAGDTIYLRGGTYSYSTTINLTNAGTPAAPIKLWAYPNEHPFIDFSSMADNDANRGFRITTNAASGLGGCYWYIKGLEVYRAGDNGMKIEGSGNIIEFCSFHHNHDSGLQIGLGDSDLDLPFRVCSNQIINCDSYLNYDPRHGGGNADGFCCKLHPGQGNVFRGCRSWENSDDGWDLYKNQYDVTLDNCWTWHNGDPASFGTNSAGNAEGFKLGGDTDFYGPRMVTRCIAFMNHFGGSGAGKAFHQNDHQGPITLLNCLSFSNNYDYALNNSGGTHTVENCVGFDPYGPDHKLVSSNSTSSDIYINNSWNLPVTPNIADYVVLTEDAAKAPRQADGSLPNNGFARLVAGSDLIDKGVNVGLPFNGPAPDLGPFEFSFPRMVLIDAISMTDTGLNLHVTGLTSDGPIVVLASPDLAAWTPIFTNPPVTGGWTYVDPNAANMTQQFYQVEEQ
ncbi:MAG TPA: right-handed parallel beta-helix repeat-containing protein [Verrucomicrobiae bacterium]|nr:right-handed parallel beta-helix repeat-containing protein [Verrucomicrobiae bacterium]